MKDVHCRKLKIVLQTICSLALTVMFNRNQTCAVAVLAPKIWVGGKGAVLSSH